MQLQPQPGQDLPQVQCDAGQIEQLLLALMMNAIDALPHGGNLWVRSRMVPEVSSVQLEVEDDGVGIPEEILSNLFEPFFTTKEKGHGVGLGLAISKGIAERHRGRHQSKPGRNQVHHHSARGCVCGSGGGSGCHGRKSEVSDDGKW